MDAHIREAGVDLPLALAEQLEAARMLEHGITKERLPFVYGWHRLSVAGPTRELCQRRVEALVEHYRDIGVDVVNSTGDQFSLLRESLPGEKVHLSSYVQRQPLYTIAGGVPTATVSLGDQPAGWTADRGGAAERADEDPGWVGPYIGEALGRARSIVHFDPLLAAVRNRPTAVAITGEPGGGKTTLALLLILQLALRGVTVAVIDRRAMRNRWSSCSPSAAAKRGCYRWAPPRRACSTRSRSATIWPRKGPWPRRPSACCCRE
jgi:Putative periplasmic protein kinase ArgK and related GTPases of G3E family